MWLSFLASVGVRCLYSIRKSASARIRIRQFTTELFRFSYPGVKYFGQAGTRFSGVISGRQAITVCRSRGSFQAFPGGNTDWSCSVAGFVLQDCETMIMALLAICATIHSY